MGTQGYFRPSPVAMRLQILLSFLILPAFGLGQLTLDVTSIPDNTPEEDALYVAGNFNGWQPGDPAYTLTDDGDGTWSITFTPPVGGVEFKFTRGDWSAPEGNATGGFQPNHVLNYSGSPITESLPILSWEDQGAGGAGTAGPGVEVLTPDFFIPQLERYRTVRIYTPPGYADGEAHYRVLYMHDGQNCFDVGTSFAGEWEVDEALDALHAEGDPGCIVVAIDNGAFTGSMSTIRGRTPLMVAARRCDVDFLVETLKPWVDEHYRTLPGRENTGIAGRNGRTDQPVRGISRTRHLQSGWGLLSHWTADPSLIVESSEHPEPMRVTQWSENWRGLLCRRVATWMPQ